MKYSTLFFLLGILIIGFACKKSESNSTTTTGTTLTASAYLVSSPWKLKSLTANPAITYQGQKVTDLTKILGDCNLDDIHTYKINGTYIVNFGAKYCDSTEKNNENGTWKLINNDAQIIINDGKGGIDTATISVNANTLNIGKKYPYNGTSITATAGFTH